MIDKGDIRTEKVVIIGSGPSGLAASLYTARGNLNPLVIAGSPTGGQLMLTSEVENYLGFQSILGPELITKMREHVKKFGTRFIEQNLLKVDFSVKPFKLYLANDNVVLTQSLIIATGAKALWLGIESETRLRGHGVSACATCDGFFFRNKTVAVIGGGDSAMEEALTLTRFASKVYIIYRGSMFRASKIMQERVMANPKIEIIWNTEVKEVLGQNKVEGIRLQTVKSVGVSQSQLNRSNHTKTMKVDGLFVAIGHKPDTDLFKNQIELDEKGYIITADRFTDEFTRSQIQNHNMQYKMNLEALKMEEIKQRFDFNYNHITSIPGVFAAGDCVDYQYRQAMTAAGGGVAAALEVERWLS